MWDGAGPVDMGRKISNEKHISRVVRHLYVDAKALDWEHMSPADKTAKYSAWLDHPEVGALLQEWMSAEEARVWIKDGPMKEYARAMAGLGPFADYLPDHPRGSQAVVLAALGEGWSIVEGSVGVKPLHCNAWNGCARVRLYWGPPNDFRHLLWAALLATEIVPSLDARIVVFDTLAHPISATQMKKQVRIGERCGFQIGHIRL